MEGGLAAGAGDCANADGAAKIDAANRTAVNARKTRLCSTRFSPDRAKAEAANLAVSTPN